MFLLVREWTASPPAGIVAALLYAFHALKIGDVVHVIIWDTSWTVFALYFATRLFQHGRARDAIGLALAVSLQVAGSLYPLLAAVVIGLPFIVWLVLHYGVKRLDPAWSAGALLFIGAVAWFALAPYFRGSAAGDIDQTPYQVYRPLSYLMPGGTGFSGWVIVLLSLAAVGLGRKRAVPALSGDPRIALVLAGLFIFSVAVVGEGGPGQATYPVVRGEPPPEGFPNLYLALSTVLPGLEVVRGPGAMYGGVHVVLCILAGLGAGAVLRLVPPRYAVVASTLLIAAAAVDTLRPSLLGLTPRIDYSMLELRPTDDALELFDSLEAAGDTGPILEVPLQHINLLKASRGLLLTAYHHRPTSYCYNSFFPEAIMEVERLGKALPSAADFTRLRELGFETLVVHHAVDDLGSGPLAKRIARFAEGDGAGTLRRLHANESLTAYEILQ